MIEPIFIAIAVGILFGSFFANPLLILVTILIPILWALVWRTTKRDLAGNPFIRNGRQLHNKSWKRNGIAGLLMLASMWLVALIVRADLIKGVIFR